MPASTHRTWAKTCASISRWRRSSSKKDRRTEAPNPLRLYRTSAVTPPTRRAPHDMMNNYIQILGDVSVGTLYDLLQVSQEASQEVIKAAYTKLNDAVVGHDSDAENRRKALEEAFLTLGNPGLRQRYDARLAAKSHTTEIESRPERSRTGLIFGALVIAAGVFGYVKYNETQERAKLERERLATEQRIAELAARKEEEQKSLEVERLRMEQIAARQQQIEFERNRRESDVNMRSNLAAEERYRREEERRLQDTERKAQQAKDSEQREAQRRLEREKALLRQLEAENSRGKRYY